MERLLSLQDLMKTSNGEQSFIYPEQGIVVRVPPNGHCFWSAISKFEHGYMARDNFRELVRSDPERYVTPYHTVRMLLKDEYGLDVLNPEEASALFDLLYLNLEISLDSDILLPRSAWATEAIISIVAYTQARHILVYSQDLSPENKHPVSERKQARLVAVYPSFAAKRDTDVIRLFFGATGERDPLFFDPSPTGFGILRDGSSGNNMHYDAILPSNSSLQGESIYLDHTINLNHSVRVSHQGSQSSSKSLSSKNITSKQLSSLSSFEQMCLVLHSEDSYSDSDDLPSDCGDQDDSKLENQMTTMHFEQRGLSCLTAYMAQSTTSASDSDSSSIDDQVIDEVKVESAASKVSPNDQQVSATMVSALARAKVKLESDGAAIKVEPNLAEFAVEPDSGADLQTTCSSLLSSPICRVAPEAVDLKLELAGEHGSGFPTIKQEVPFTLQDASQPIKQEAAVTSSTASTGNLAQAVYTSIHHMHGLLSEMERELGSLQEACNPFATRDLRAYDIVEHENSSLRAALAAATMEQQVLSDNYKRLCVAIDQLESENYQLRADHTTLLRRVSAVSDLRDDDNAAARAGHQRLLIEINRLELELRMSEERERALRLEQSTFAFRHRLSTDPRCGPPSSVFGSPMDDEPSRVSSSLLHSMTELLLEVSQELRLFRDSRTVPNSDQSASGRGQQCLLVKTPRRPLRLSTPTVIVGRKQNSLPCSARRTRQSRVSPSTEERESILQCAQSIPALRKSLDLIRLVYGHDTLRLEEQEQLWRTMIITHWHQHNSLTKGHLLIHVKDQSALLHYNWSLQRRIFPRLVQCFRSSRLQSPENIGAANMFSTPNFPVSSPLVKVWEQLLLASDQLYSTMSPRVKTVISTVSPHLSQLSSYVNTGITSFFQASPLQPSQRERESVNVSMIHSDELASRQQNSEFPRDGSADDLMVSEAAMISKTIGSKKDSRAQKRSLVDSGATSVMRQNQEDFQYVAPVATMIRTAAENAVIKATQQGLLTIGVRTSAGNIMSVELDDALVVPNLRTQLTAVSALVDAGHLVFFTEMLSGFFPITDSSTFVPFVREGNQWYLEEHEASEMAAIANEDQTASKISAWQLWHLKLGHVNHKYMCLARDRTVGMSNLSAQCPEFVCHCCKEAKLRHANKASSSSSRASQPLGLVHADTFGPYRVEGISGSRYATIFTDDNTRYRWIYCHRKKDDLPKILRRFLADVKALNVNGKTYAVLCIRTDNRGEYTGAEFENILLEHLIRHEYSNPYEQFQNGVAERSNGVVTSMGRAVHLTSGLPKKVWPLVVRHSVYILNRTPTRSNVKSMTPYEALFGEKPDISKLKPFGCLMYGFVHKAQSSDWKMDPRGIAMAYVGDGEADGSKAAMGYKLGKDGAGAIVYTTSFWTDQSFFPCRPKTDRRLTTCSFGSYPDLANEIVQLYTIPSDDDLVESVGNGQLTVLELRKSLEQTSQEQINNDLLERVKKQVEDFKTGRKPADRENGTDELEASPELRDMIFKELESADVCRRWELLGYCDTSDRFLIRSGDVNKFVDAQDVFEHINKSGRVFSSVLGMDFDSYDGENEQLIAHHHDTNSSFEIDSKFIKDKLRSILNSFLQGLISNETYDLQSGIMSKLLRKAQGTVDENKGADDSTLESLLTVLAVEEFASVMKEHRRNDDEPTLREALRSRDRQKWIEAVREEINKLIARGVFRFISKQELPEGKKAFPLHIVLKRKRNQFGEITRYKARCVLDGSQMKKNVDYFESYAPVVDFTNVRLIVSVAHANRWELRSYDIVLAFTLARPQVHTFVRFRGLDGVVDGIGPGQLAEVLWNLYGDVAAPHSWYQTLKPALLGMGFVEAGGHPCVLIRRTQSVVDGIEQVSVIILTVYVDDLIVAASSSVEFVWFEGALGKCFEFTTQGKLKYCLGVEFILSEDSRYLTLTQQGYSKKILDRFGMLDCRGAKTPMDCNSKLSLGDCPRTIDPELQKEYRAKVGSLQYLSMWTRPDLAYTVSILSRFLHAPGPKHLLAANRALQYLKDTMEIGITYVSDSSLLSPIFAGLNTIVGYSDADFGGDLDTSKSMTGYVILMNNGPIAWKSGRQTNVALSTSAAETVALMKATVMIKHLRMMLFDLGMPQCEPTTVHVDNKAAICVSEGKDVMHQTTKHVTVQCRYVMECVQLGAVVLTYIPTFEQRADIFTKALSGTLFRYHRDSLMFKVKDVYERAMMAVKVTDVPPDRQNAQIDCCVTPIEGDVDGGTLASIYGGNDTVAEVSVIHVQGTGAATSSSCSVDYQAYSSQGSTGLPGRSRVNLNSSSGSVRPAGSSSAPVRNVKANR
mmetsp:Transcript_55929/g.117024  ORF Transcript_55929/g.117024 Transcript_55929/m.117024 type:complete len:2321 (-) Transcript_55929:82-7044(-)